MNTYDVPIVQGRITLPSQIRETQKLIDGTLMTLFDVRDGHILMGPSKDRARLEAFAKSILSQKARITLGSQ
jgi:bifunctional DNA-binding transcriptional regulator/antitoxin component of YhaV-PrlF toxin-antitoxin module